MQRAYSTLGDEQRRQALGQIFEYENSQKAVDGYYAALLDAKAMAAKGEEEKDLRARVAAGPCRWTRVESSKRSGSSAEPTPSSSS